MIMHKPTIHTIDLSQFDQFIESGDYGILGIEAPKKLQKSPPTIRGDKRPLLAPKNDTQLIEDENGSMSIQGASGCCTQKMSKNSLQTLVIIGLDWLTLQINIRCLNEAFRTPNEFEFFSIDHKEVIHGKYWQKIYKVITTINGKPEVYADLETDNVHDSISHSNLRIHNKWLYGTDRNEIMKMCFDTLGFQFKGISRMDVYIDHQKMNNRCSPSPAHFIKKVFAGEYLKQGRASFMPFAKNALYNEALDRYNDEREDFIPYAKTGERVHVTGCRWGKASSGFQIRWYNKTEEMRDKMLKPWIEQSWNDAGFSAQLDTWRIEAQINTHDFYTFDRTTGEVIAAMKDIDSITDEKIQYIGTLIFKRHMKFHRTQVAVNGKRKKLNDRKRRLPQFYPVNIEDVHLQKITIRNEQHSGRTEKTEIKNLVKLWLQVKDQPSSTEKSIKRVLGYRVGLYGLHSWFHQKFSEINFGEDFDTSTFIPQHLHSQQINFKNCPLCNK